MTIKQLIKRFEELPKDTHIKIYDCFGKMFSSNFNCISWRGDYTLPAVIVEETDENEYYCYTVETCVRNLKDSIGKTVRGWKGGEFVLDENSEVFLVSDESKVGCDTIISEVLDSGYCVVKLNAY